MNDEACSNEISPTMGQIETLYTCGINETGNDVLFQQGQTYLLRKNDCWGIETVSALGQ